MGGSLNRAAVEGAQARLRDFLSLTPTLHSVQLDSRLGATVRLKAEHQQKTGSFKFRGAMNSLLLHASETPGVVTASSGNHGQAIAFAARLLEIPAVVVIPENTTPEKTAAISRHGADIVRVGRRSMDRQLAALEIASDRGWRFVHPYDDADVIAGQGTTALELASQAPDIEVLLVPVGGGGLASGCASVIREGSFRPQLIGVEPAGADDTRKSIKAGKVVHLDNPDSIADGLLVSRPGNITFSILKDALTDVITVTDQQIVNAMNACHDIFGIVTEPSAVVGIAALEAHKEMFRNREVATILTGGNISMQRFQALTGIDP